MFLYFFLTASRIMPVLYQYTACKHVNKDIYPRPSGRCCGWRMDTNSSCMLCLSTCPGGIKPVLTHTSGRKATWPEIFHHCRDTKMNKSRMAEHATDQSQGFTELNGVYLGEGHRFKLLREAAQMQCHRNGSGNSQEYDYP